MSKWLFSYLIVAGSSAIALSSYGAPDTSLPAASPSVYQPVTSDLMNAFIQPRHIKLWLAGQSGDWTSAEYERHNIGGAFGRIVAAIPTYKGAPVDALVAAFVTPQLAELEAAIKARDKAAFIQAYGSLTAGCNGCHQTTEHSFVIIKQPSGGGFADQDYKASAQ